jgi:hypothetical protein
MHISGRIAARGCPARDCRLRCSRRHGCRSGGASSARACYQYRATRHTGSTPSNRAGRGNATTPHAPGTARSASIGRVGRLRLRLECRDAGPRLLTSGQTLLPAQLDVQRVQRLEHLPVDLHQPGLAGLAENGIDLGVAPVFRSRRRHMERIAGGVRAGPLFGRGGGSVLGI